MGRQRSLYAKAITFLIQGPANALVEEREREVSEEINTCMVKHSVFCTSALEHLLKFKWHSYRLKFIQMCPKASLP